MIPFTVAKVPTGINLGVFTGPFGVLKIPVLASVSSQLDVISKSNTIFKSFFIHKSTLLFNSVTFYIAIKKHFINNLAGAWIFYTTLPKIPFISPRFKNIAQFAPLIGFLIGTIQSLIYLFFRNNSWSVFASILLCLGAGYLITGGLHIDGLMDTFDGIFAGKKKCLKAMKDSQVGSFGVQSLVFTTLIQIACLSRIQNEMIFILPICCFWGRFSTIIFIDQFRYLTFKKKSISHKKHWNGFLKESSVSLSLLIVLLFYYFISFKSIETLLLILFLILVGFFVSYKIPQILGNKIGGFNGDACGASVIIVETTMLFMNAILL